MWSEADLRYHFYWQLPERKCIMASVQAHFEKGLRTCAKTDPSSTDQEALQNIQAFDDLVDDVLEEDEALAKRFNGHSVYQTDSASTPPVDFSSISTNGVQRKGSKMRYNSWVLLMIGDLSLFWSAALPIGREEVENGGRYMKYARRNLPPLTPINTQLEAYTTAPEASRAMDYITPISLLYQPIIGVDKPLAWKELTLRRIEGEFRAFIRSSPWGIVSGIVNDNPVGTWYHILKAEG